MRRQILAVVALAAALYAAGAYAQVDGTLDSAFGAGGAVRIPFDLPDSGLFDRPTAVGVDGAGRLVVAGLAESYNGFYLTTSGALARLTLAPVRYSAACRELDARPRSGTLKREPDKR